MAVKLRTVDPVNQNGQGLVHDGDNLKYGWSVSERYVRGKSGRTKLDVCCTMWRMKLRFLLALCLAASAAAQTTADNVKPAPPVAPDTVAPSAVNEPLLAARALMKKDQLKDAAAAFKALVEKDPTLADAHAGLIRCLLRSNQLDDADFAGTRALAALPSSALVHASVGDVAFRAGNFGDAEKEYRAALKIDTNSARSVYGMGRMLQMVSMNKRAKENYARAHQLDPEDGEITRYWLETLTYAERLEQDKKTEGDPDNKANMRRYLTAVAEKKPWLMVNEIKPMEIKMPLYGRNLAGVQDISRSGPKNIYEGYGLQVRFNDRSSAMLLVDTGAGGIVIGRRLAERIGAVKIADTRIFGIGDKGPVESHNQRMVLEPLPPNPSGASVDEEWQDRYIAPQMQGFTKFYRFGHDIVVPVLVNDKATGNFILDTGAGINSMSPKFALQVTKAEADGEYRMKGVSGRVSQVLTGQKAILQFAKMRIESHDLPVFSADNISASDGTEIAGFIGIRVLSQMKMTIDYRDGLVNLEVYEFKKARE